MLIFILLLILAAFLQTSFLPVNLVLVLIICRSFVVLEKSDYYIAFFMGIFLGLLSSQNIGFWATIYLLVVALAHTAKKLPFSNNTLVILPIALLGIFFSNVVELIVFKRTLTITKVLIETLISFPAYFLISFLENRYVVKTEIKLKIRN